MKLVISTQIRENYAAHNGFTGEYYWKYKGGNTYVVDGITAAQKARIERDGIPTLTELLEERNDYYEEYILAAQVVGDREAEGEEWDTPFRLRWNGTQWIAGREIDNTTEYGYMCREILKKYESYVMAPGGERSHYIAAYDLRNGKFVRTEEELREALAEMEDA